MGKVVTKVTTEKRDQTASRIIKAIMESTGFLTVAAQRAGVTYRTVWRYANDYPSVRQAVLESKEAMLDLAENRLLENIKKGDNTSIIFYLKTQGKARGYIEKTEIMAATDVKIHVVYEERKQLPEPQIVIEQEQ